MITKKRIEKWAVSALYDLEFQRFGRLNKKTRKIIFNWQGRILFSIWPSRKERLCIAILAKWYRYTFWEEKLSWCSPIKPDIQHTWGEIQDIIRMYNRIRIKPAPLLKLKN